jgi:hypothetical protein
MTHFSVLVIGDNVEIVLEQYDENIEVTPYVGQPAYIVERDFRRHQVSCFTKLFKGETLDAFDELTLTLDKVNADWWERWSGESLDSEGNALTTYNPNSKWDWYSIGGRWTGALILKDDAEGRLGVSGVFDNQPEHDADISTIGDVDWVAMNKLAKEKSAKEWDNLFKPYDNHDFCLYNKDYVEKQKKIHLEIYGTKEEYVRRRGFWTTYALVTEDEWIAPGEMGWFGLSTDETIDREAYDNKFVSYLKSLPKNTAITVVDCHI